MSRNLVVDFSKIALALMVVAIHTGLFSEFFGPYSYTVRLGIFRVAVPVFFIFNGYYLGLAVHNRHSTHNVIKRILMLYGFWMLVYLPFYWHAESVSLFTDLKEFAWVLFFGYYQLWYLIGMVYAVVLLRAVRKLGTPQLLVLGLGLFIIAATMQYLDAYSGINFAPWQYRNGILFGFPFVLAGYLLRTKGDHVSTHAAWWMLLVGLCTLMAEAFFAHGHARDNQKVDIYLSLIVVAPAATLIMVRTVHQIHTDFAAKMSTHIYLIHTLMITATVSWLKVPLTASPLFGAVVLLSLLTFLPIYYLSKKIRFIL